MLGDIFGIPVLISVTTTLVKISALSILIGDEDAIIIDHQCHNRFETSAQLMKARGLPITFSRNNDMDYLEAKIENIAAKHKNVWYLADIFYSMYGYYANFNGLNALLRNYKTLNI